MVKRKGEKSKAREVRKTEKGNKTLEGMRAAERKRGMEENIGEEIKGDRSQHREAEKKRIRGQETDK